MLLLFLSLPAWAQGEPPVDRASSDQGEESVDSTGTADAPPPTTTALPTAELPDVPVPGWVHLVRLAAIAGPVAFLVLAWAIGGIVHYRLVRREQEQFPIIRGSRKPQTIPMLISSALFLSLGILFVAFEWLSRNEMSRGIGGVVDQWHPVTTQAVLALVVCLVLAIVPWLFARRADTVA
ncbi:MAG TPA: hypothetical protein VN181_07760 [Thermoanaerobaculia bacterium]|nr:hypothetical protein [Thermoanaerobaculia bacterium]